MTSTEDRDPLIALGIAVVLAALAGISAMLGAHLLIGALRLTAGILAGAAAGAGMLAVPRLARHRIGRLLAFALALTLALALTVPAVIAARPAGLGPHTIARLDPLSAGDELRTPPAPDAPAFIHRADGTVELIDDHGVRRVATASGATIAVTADGQRLVEVAGETTTLHLLDPTLSSPDGAPPTTSVPGTPLAFDGTWLVMRECEEAGCYLHGYDLSDGSEKPVWTTAAADLEDARGPDPAETLLPARPETPPDLLDALRTTGLLPTIPLHFDPAQGWLQLDPSTGFPLGEVLARPEETCRIAVTTAPPGTGDALTGPAHPWQVLTVCTEQDGALIARAHADGTVLWESKASPGGDWEVLLGSGRVLATGTEQGTDVVGELVVSEQAAAWQAPGGEGVQQAAMFRARVGIDPVRMVVANDIGQLVAYDTVEGTDLWSAALTSPDAPVRGRLGAGTAVVLDPLERTRPLTPRGAQRLRVIDATSGEVSVQAQVGRGITEVRPLPGGRALVADGTQLVLIGP